MIRLKPWQWVLLGLPLVAIVTFILTAAAIQLHTWHANWIWAIVVVLLVGWRWLLVRWTRPAVQQLETLVAEVEAELKDESTTRTTESSGRTQQIEASVQEILETARQDVPLWEDWGCFWLRCQQIVTAVAHAYYPDAKRPLLNIYLPQAYTLIRGTVDDLDLWMQKLAPALNQVTVGQAYEAYEIYQRLEPSARKLWRVWNWAQWLLNPAAAIARQATQQHGNRANQQLLANLSQLLREAALKNLAQQATLLYSGSTPPTVSSLAAAPAATQTQTLRELLSQAESPDVVDQKPVNILLVGRTGAGKSSLINTLFVADQAEVDALPSTEHIQDYCWQASTGEVLNLWDTPGYEQADHPELREIVLDHVRQADLLILVTPALDPALQMDVDFLQELEMESNDLPAIAVVTQVDRLRPIREWNPPYDWEWGNRPKEVAIREALQYRIQQLDHFCDQILPVVTGHREENRMAWGVDTLSLSLIDAITPTKQLRLARFLRDLNARAVAAAKIIDHYTFQMATTQGLAALIKSPVLSFISTLTTGTPTLAYLLAEKIPVEQMPTVIGKLQMAYDLFNLLSPDSPKPRDFNLLALWPLLLDNSTSPDHNARAFGHALVEYWTQNLTTEQLKQRFDHYLAEFSLRKLSQP